MKVHAGVDKDSGLIHSVVTTAAELLYGDEEVVYGDAGYQGIGKRRALPDTPDGRLQDLTETAKADVRAQVEHPCCKINVLAALTKLFLARRRLLATAVRGDWCAPKGLLKGSRQRCKAKNPPK